MRKHNHIKALLFLGIFSMLLLHQVLPHLHHQHKVAHTHKDVAHNQSHHHHDTPKNESLKKGFLDLFLDMHAHSVVSSEMLLTYDRSVKQLNVKKNVSTPFSVVHYRLFVSYDDIEKEAVYHPPNNYFNPYLSFLDSRGPPSLG